MQFKNLKKSGPLLSRLASDFSKDLPAIFDGNQVDLTLVDNDFADQLERALKQDIPGAKVRLNLHPHLPTMALFFELRCFVNSYEFRLHVTILEGEDLSMKMSGGAAVRLKGKPTWTTKKAVNPELIRHEWEDFLSKFDQYGFKMEA